MEFFVDIRDEFRHQPNKPVPSWRLPSDISPLILNSPMTSTVVSSRTKPLAACAFGTLTRHWWRRHLDHASRTLLFDHSASTGASISWCSSTCIYGDGGRYGDNSYTVGTYAQDALTLSSSWRRPIIPVRRQGAKRRPLRPHRWPHCPRSRRTLPLSREQFKNTVASSSVFHPAVHILTNDGSVHADVTDTQPAWAAPAAARPSWRWRYTWELRADRHSGGGSDSVRRERVTGYASHRICSQRSLRRLGDPGRCINNKREDMFISFFNAQSLTPQFGNCNKKNDVRIHHSSLLKRWPKKNIYDAISCLSTVCGIKNWLDLHTGWRSKK